MTGRELFASGRLDRRDAGDGTAAPAAGRRHPPRPSQWRAIRETGRHQLVAAGAGTGKTFTVVGKVLWLLGLEVEGERHPDPIRLRDLVAITYTNQAAADLKSKLREALRQAGRQDLANEVDLARIGTIHAFCGDVLRDFALRSQRSPFRRIWDEGESTAATGDAAREALLEALETDAVPGLDALLGDWSSSDIVGWVITLISESDRLATLRGRADELGAEERTLVALASLAEARLAERLEREAAVDFDRMVVWTRDLIRDEPSVRGALQRRIRALIIDEFQDVDPVQKEIAYMLAEPASGRTDTPRLMLVGDPKQSIYRFRRADVTVWREVERDFQEAGHGVVVPLEDNFRSVPQILGFVDSTVGRILDRPLNGIELQDYEVPYRRVEATRAPADEPAVEAILVPPQEGGRIRRTEEVRTIEAESIARRARELHRAGVPWGGMALLLRSWYALDIYRTALERAGIPVYALQGEGFLETREVVDMITALEAVRDPRDDRALFGFLRGPFVAVKDETLLRVARTAHRPYWPRLRGWYHDDDPAPEEGRLGGFAGDEAARLRRGLELLHRFTALRDRLPTDQLLDELLHQGGYLAHLALLGEDGKQRVANVRQFLQMAASAADTGLGDFLRTLRERRQRGDRAPEAPLYGENDDVLTITSVHSAKGLEWPVVFWADMARGSWTSYPDLLLGRGEIRLKRPDTHHEDQPKPYQELVDRNHREEDAEERRLWYVAATRAMDRLILTGLPQGKGLKKDTTAKQLALLLPDLLDAADGDKLEYRGGDGLTWELVARVASAEAEALDAGREAEETPASRPVRDADTLLRPRKPVAVPLGPARHSATEFLVHSRCPRRHWFRYIAGVQEPEPEATGAEILSAVRRGQIVHEVLERIHDEEELPGLLEVAIGRWDEHAPPPETDRGRQYREHLGEEIERVLSHPDYREIFEAHDAKRELGFARIARDGSAAVGRIDLAAPGQNGLRLLDVKTTQCDDDAIPDKVRQYTPQRDVYVTAAADIAGRPVNWFAFQFSAAGAHARQLYDDDARQRSRTAVHTMTAAIGAGDRSLTEHPEECWFCGYRRVGLCPGAAGAGKAAED